MTHSPGFHLWTRFKQLFRGLVLKLPATRGEMHSVCSITEQRADSMAALVEQRADSMAALVEQSAGSMAALLERRADSIAALADQRSDSMAALFERRSDLLTLRVSELGQQVDEVATLLAVVDRRGAATSEQLQDALTLVRISEERSRSIEALLRESLTLLQVTETRTRTLEYTASQSQFGISYLQGSIHKLYVESPPSFLGESGSLRATAKAVRLVTDYPIAVFSNDHLIPDSTSEGAVRPSAFVLHCTDVIGKDIRCLDLGAGAAGLIYEFIANGVFALGVDGSDYCKKNKIGFWPLIPEYLYTCDITRPFQFRHLGKIGALDFNLITSWEVLEHIAAPDLPELLRNVRAHLGPDGYFMGSVSMLEYGSADGTPYHVTLQPKTWWELMFKQNGLIMLNNHPFDERLFCRGNGPRFQDFHNYRANPKDGFHFVAVKSGQ